MCLATLDNKATSETLRNNLRELPAYAAKVKNIDEIHTYFDVNYSQLKARGEEYNDKMPPCGKHMHKLEMPHCSSMQTTYTPSTLMVNYQQHLITSN